MANSLVLFSVLAYISCICRGQVIKDVVQVMNGGKERNGCSFDDFAENVTCSIPEGQEYLLNPLERVPAYSSCYIKGESGKQERFLCLANGLKVEESLIIRKGTASRERRAAGLVFGIIGVIVGIASWICSFVCKSDYPPPNQPPTLKCPVPYGSQPVYANTGQDTAVVNWSKPTATDPEGTDVRISYDPSSYKSGQKFAEGRYAIAFLAVDDGSASDSCVMEFEVKVYRCGAAPYLQNGQMSCTGHILGKSCTAACSEGYQIESGTNATITCEKIGWSMPAPVCVPVPCKALPTVHHGFIVCPDNIAVFGAACVTQCDDGFKFSGPYFLSCDENGTWRSLPVCKDSEPPSFKVGTCPDNILKNIDSPDNTAVVEWLLPEGQDNSGEAPVIEEVNGYVPNSKYSAGSYILRYNITDREGNVGQPCTFELTIETIYCDPPSLSVEGASHMVYTCPDRYRYGAECALSCKAGYPLGGTNKIQCNNTDESADPPILDWTWPTDALGPYCKETVCPDLNIPENGATACDLWMLGRQCQIQCESGYDFALSFPDVYVCTTNSGLWRPTEQVPDCSRKLAPNQATLMSDVYYYTGKCNSSKENLRQIQENFIKALNSSAYNAVCIDEPFCRAEFVNVTCGSVASRRKRDISQHRLETRSSNYFAYIVLFELLLSLDNGNQTIEQQFQTKAAKLQGMVNEIQTEMDNGHFDIHLSDMHLESDSFGPGFPSFKCPEGTKARMSTGSCAGCPVGMFMSEKMGECEDCPIGTYQDVANSVVCKPCPHQTNTTGSGSENIQQCLAICSAGYYSLTGLAPCIECSSTSYQPFKGQSSCLPCDPLSKTADVGATSKSHCQAYDVMISSGTGANVRNISSQSIDVAIVTWIFIRNLHRAVTLFDIDSNGDPVTVVLQTSGEITFDFNGSKLDTGVLLVILEWKHLAIMLDQSSKKISVYLNGRSVYVNETTFLQSKAFFNGGGNFSINADIQLNSFYVLDSSMSQRDIQQYASSCSQNISGSLISQDDIDLTTSAKSIIPSKCDDVNECSDPNPCGSHSCINKLGGFECACSGGYTGTLCDIPPDFCQGTSCLNGATCETGKTNYTCLCPYGFHGTHCEFRAKNGGWSEWSDWALCSKTCGEGSTMRHRRCDSPPPDPDGQPCNGVDNETKTCNSDKCPECSRLRRTIGLIIQCNETEASKRCRVSCRDGLFFATNPLLEYECGRVTGYKWNHQTADNPNARLPTCSAVKLAESVSVAFMGEYDVNPCDKEVASLLMTGLEEKLQNTTCIKAGNCGHKVSTNECGSSREKRSESTTVTISLDLHINQTGLGTTLESLLVNKTAHASLITLLENVYDLEKTAQEIYNNSEKFLQVTVSEKSLTPISSMPVPDTTVICPQGAVKLDIFCAVVPQGSYLNGTSAIPCPKDEYQDLAGQTQCKKCPSGTLTEGIGSTAVSDCISSQDDLGNGDHREKENEDKGNGDPYYRVHVAIGVSVSVVVLVLTIVTAMLAHKHMRKKKNQVNVSLFSLQIPPETYMLEKPFKA